MPSHEVLDRPNCLNHSAGLDFTIFPIGKSTPFGKYLFMEDHTFSTYRDFLAFDSDDSVFRSYSAAVRPGGDSDLPGPDPPDRTQ